MQSVAFGLRRSLAAVLALVAAALVPAQGAVVFRARATPEVTVAVAKAAVPPAAELGDASRLEAALGGLAHFAAGASRGVGEGIGKGDFPQQITVQVPEEELKQLTAKMSTQCKAQVFGEGSQLHTFGDQGKRDKAQCQDLQGTLCSVSASVESFKAQDGRKMHSKSVISGSSCLPKQCRGGSDLKVLSSFMKLKAEGALGAQVSVAMDVDCSQHGGAAVEIAGDPKKLGAKPPASMKSAAPWARPPLATLALMGAIMLAAVL